MRAGYMIKKLLAVLLFVLLQGIAFSQEDEINDPDEAGTSVPNVGILEAEPIIEIVEGVGAINTSNVAFRAAPDIESALIRYGGQGERVLLIGESGDWFKVIMYNNAKAYINKKYVSTNKIARDEQTTSNDMDKPTSIMISDIIERFNYSLKHSPFAQKFKIIPYLTIIDERQIKNKMALTFLYSCIDLDGKMIPSYKENVLKNEMKALLEILFFKLLLSGAESYELTIKTPTFGEKGEIKNTSKIYAIINLESADVDMQTIRLSPALIWQYAKLSVPVEKLFEKYP